MHANYHTVEKEKEGRPDSSLVALCKKISVQKISRLQRQHCDYIWH
jgi:hypothetical protein